MARPKTKLEKGLSLDRANILASAYLTNGFNKAAAMREAGYSDGYARCKGTKVFAHERVQAAIARLQALGQLKTGYSISLCEDEYEKARELAMKINQPAAAVSAITGKARLYGFDKDGTASREEPVDIPKELLEQLKKEAIEDTKPKLVVSEAV